MPFFLINRQLFNADGRRYRPTPGVISAIAASYTLDTYRTVEAALHSLLRDLRALEPGGVGNCDETSLELTLRDGDNVVTAHYRSRYAPIMRQLSDFARRVAVCHQDESVRQATFGPDYPFLAVAQEQPIRGSLIAAAGETDPECTAQLLQLDDVEFVAMMALALEGYPLRPLLAAS
jgi:hypothetical protein